MFLTSDGVRLAVRESGPADAPVTVVFVHDWMSTSSVWDDVLPLVTARVRTVRLDLRGHGGSAKAPPGTATVERLGEDLAELVERRVPDGKLVLVGHSLGAMAIAELAERHPELVQERAAGVVLYYGAETALAGAVFGLPQWVLTAGHKVTAGLARVRLPRPPRGLPGTPRSASTTAPAVLRRVPVVVLAGAGDRTYPPEQVRALAAGLPSATCVPIRDTGYLLAFERPTELARQVDRLATGR